MSNKDLLKGSNQSSETNKACPSESDPLEIQVQDCVDDAVKGQSP